MKRQRALESRTRKTYWYFFVCVSGTCYKCDNWRCTINWSIAICDWRVAKSLRVSRSIENSNIFAVFLSILFLRNGFRVGPIINTVILNQKTSTWIEFTVYVFFWEGCLQKINDIKTKTEQKYTKNRNRITSKQTNKRDIHITMHIIRVQRSFSASLWCKARQRSTKKTPSFIVW